MTKIIISGGFHNSSAIELRIKNKMSVNQYKKLVAHMCNFHDCKCGRNAWQISGIPKDQFDNLFTSASIDAYCK